MRQINRSARIYANTIFMWSVGVQFSSGAAAPSTFRKDTSTTNGEIGFSAVNLGRSICLPKVEGLRHAGGRASMLSHYIFLMTTQCNFRFLVDIHDEEKESFLVGLRQARFISLLIEWDD